MDEDVRKGFLEQEALWPLKGAQYPETGRVFVSRGWGNGGALGDLF